MKTQTFEQLKKQLQKEETESEASLENRALMRAARDQPDRTETATRLS